MLVQRTSPESSLKHPGNMLQSVPEAVWSSSDFDCQRVLEQLVHKGACREVSCTYSSPVDESLDALTRIQDEIKVRLVDNERFFARGINKLADSHRRIGASLDELDTFISLEAEATAAATERAHGFSTELKRIAGRIIELAAEKRSLSSRIIKRKQLQMIGTPPAIDLASLLTGSSTWSRSNRVVSRRKELSRHCQHSSRR